MIYGSVCSGISSESVAWKPLGWSPAWFSEIAPFPSAVLAHRYPQIPNLGDVNKIHEKAEFKKGEIDILVGGTPCQGFSQAGRREGFGDPRARLALRFLEVAEMLRPRMALYGRTSPRSCPRTEGKTLVPSSGKWGSSGTGTVGTCWTREISVSPRAGVASSLSDIMETGEGRLRHSLSEAALNQVRKRIPERYRSARMTAVLTGTEGS